MNNLDFQNLGYDAGNKNNNPSDNERIKIGEDQFLYQINVTRECNLRCTHCYISSDKKDQSDFMSEEQFILSFERLCELMKSKRGKTYSTVDIHVIGGEPTLLGVEFYKRTLPKIRSMLDELDQEYQLGIVTNLITPQALEIARMFDAIATSYEIDTRFVSKTGKPKPSLEKKWVENLNQMQSEGHEIAATMAVTTRAIEFGAKKILDYFYSVGIKKAHFGFFIPSGDGLINMDDLFPSFDQTSEFMIDSAEWYIERRLDDPDLFINPCESMIESIYRKKSMDDVVCPIIPGSLDIDWNGETVTCIQAGGDTWSESLGNVFEKSIEEIMDGRSYRRARASAIQPKPGCFGCDEMESCKAACGILHGYWDGEGDCPGFKRFIKYVRDQVENNNVTPKSILSLPGMTETGYRARMPN